LNAGVRNAIVAIAFGTAPCLSSASAQTGVQVNTDPGTGLDVIGDAANEPTMVVNPTDPLNVIIGWRQFPTIESAFRKAGVSHSTDGGHTWSGIATLPDAPGPPNPQQTDPVLSANAAGTIFFWSERFEPSFGLFVYPSEDGGETWDTPASVPLTNTGDKGWLEIDVTGGTGNDHQYGVWTGNYNTNPHIFFVRSIDDGETFSAPVRISDAAGTKWMSHLAVGPAGELYVAWRNYPQNAIFITKSTNANDPDETPTFDALGAGGFGGLDVEVDEGNDPGFIPINPTGFHQIWVDVDRSGGPRNGFVYCLWADDRNDVCDIMFARSEDGGAAWINGIRVNDDALGNDVYQWMAAMDVAPDGRIDAVWYDTRDDPDNERSSLYYSFSDDGGATWSTNRRISDDFDTTIGFPVQQKIGDYNQIRSDSLGVHTVYAATYNGGQDLYWLREYTCGRPGDLNGDRLHDGDDIQDFVDVLAGVETNPDIICRGDLNGDGVTDEADVPLFVQTLTGDLAW